MTTAIDQLDVRAYTIPTDKPESDGTLAWKETTMILVRAGAHRLEGLGYTYGHASLVSVIQSLLEPVVRGRDAMEVPAIQTVMVDRVRNNGQCGLAMMAVSAVDIALWDLKAKLLGLSLCRLLGQARESIAVYGSGGFTSYSDQELTDQLGGWAEQGISAVKMKVGRDPGADLRRVRVARDAIGGETGLFVDANGAWSDSQAVQAAAAFSELGVTWLEEPVVAAEARQLREIRRRMPAGMRVVAGEYGYRLTDFRDLLAAEAVDVLQADATRCGGITGFLKAGCLAEAFHIPFSSHCAPAVHLHPALSLPAFSIAEYFHDHVRIEGIFFEGGGLLRQGHLFPDIGTPGLGLVLREKEVERYRVA